MASNSLSKGQQNFTRLAIACVDEIKLVFKDSLESQIKPVDLYNAINTCSILTTGKHQLNAHQLNICRISPPQVPDYDKFDVSLLYKLIRNLCPKFKPTKGWGNKPDTNDLQIGDDIERLRLVRNEMLAHFESSDVPDGTFTTSWKELKSSFPRVQKFMTSLGYSVNYEDKLIDIEKLDLGLEDMKKYRVLLEGMIILCKQPQNKDVSKITVNGNGKILCGEKACFEAETEKCHDNSNWPITWERVRGSATEVIATSAEKYKGSSSRRLVIPQVVKGDEGEYRAVISREIDGIHVTIPSNTLFLQALGNPPNLDIFQATSGIDGVTIHYNCNADKAYPVIKEIEWRKDGELLTMNTNKYEGGGVTDKYLKILSPSDNDSGEYTCRVFNAVGSDVKCLVLGAPSVEICKELTVLLGSEVTIDPVIQSCPSLEKAIWQKSKAQAPEDFMTIDINDDQYFGSSLDPEKPVLVITKASHADNLYYRLEVSNGIRKSTSNAVLLKLVGDPPSVFTNVETNISDRSVTLLCKVSHSDNSPEVTKVVWTKDKRYINISSSGGKYAGGSTADPSLVVQNVNSNDAGEYQCCVSNVVGSMISNPIHLGKPKVHISSYEKDDETERTTCKITIESIPEVKAAEWRVQQSPEDDFQTIDVHATTYKGSTVSLPQPYLIVHGYNLNQSQRFQIRVTNFIGETTEIINDKKQDSEEHDQKELDDGMNFYRKGVIKIPFANLRYDLHDAFPQDKLENLKYLLICQEEVDEDTVSASNSLGDVLEILIKRGLFRKNDVILVQYLLRKIGCYDLYETCYKYAKDCEALCFFESQPENGYKNVKFHIDGNIEKYSKKDIYFIRKTVAKMLNCPEEHIAITGLEHDKSFVLILSIKEEYINVLLKHAQQILEHLCSLNVDYLACGEIVIRKKQSSQVVEETVSQSADPEVSTKSSSNTTYTQMTSADTSKKVNPSNSATSIPIEVIHVSTVVSDETREGESCMKINRNQDEDKALEIADVIAKYNLLSQTSFSDSQEQNNDEEGNVEKTIISLDSEDEVNEESTNKMKDIEMAVGYTKPLTDETDYCVFERNDMSSHRTFSPSSSISEHEGFGGLQRSKSSFLRPSPYPFSEHEGFGGLQRDMGSIPTLSPSSSISEYEGFGGLQRDMGSFPTLSPSSSISEHEGFGGLQRDMSLFLTPSPSSFSDHDDFDGLERGGSLSSTSGREMPRIRSTSSAQMRSRMHRFSALFYGSHWSKPDEREREIEKEKEREKERQVVLGLERRREERKRERRSSDRERRSSADLEESKGRPFVRGIVQHPHTLSSYYRSRSRSPRVGGRVESAQSDSSYNRDEKDIIKVKEEKLNEPEISVMDRERNTFRPEYLLRADRTRARVGLPQYPFGADRIPPSQSLWRFEEASFMNSIFHQFYIQGQQEQEQMLPRLQPSTVDLNDPERVRKDEFFLQQERLMRQYLDHSQQFAKERFERETLLYSRLGHSRPIDPLSSSDHFPRTKSPLVNQSELKVGSPTLLQRPPLLTIPSSSTSTDGSHSNSTAMTKLKLPSNFDLDKRDSEG